MDIRKLEFKRLVKIPPTLGGVVKWCTFIAKGLMTGEVVGVKPLAFGYAPKVHDPQHGEGMMLAIAVWDDQGAR